MKILSFTHSNISGLHRVLLGWDNFVDKTQNSSSLFPQIYPSRTGILKSGLGGPLPCRVLLKPTYLRFSRDPEDLDELAQVCLIRVEAKLCSALALQGKIWGTLQYDFIGFWIIAENKLNDQWKFLMFCSSIYSSQMNTAFMNLDA